MMVNYLRKSFEERVDQMDWLSDFSKQSSIEKLKAITAHSAYPAKLLDDYNYNYYFYVQEFYSRVSKN